MVRLLLLAVVASACALPIAGPAPGPAADVTPPKVVNDVDIDEDVLCDHGYCGEGRIAASVGIGADRYAAISVAPISQSVAEDLAVTLAAEFDRAKRPRVVVDTRDCGYSEACTVGEYDGTIRLYEPTLGTLLHELGHHLATLPPYVKLDAGDDWREHSDGFEWALADVYAAYLAADVDHATLELPPLPKPASYAVGQ